VLVDDFFYGRGGVEHDEGLVHYFEGEYGAVLLSWVNKQTLVR
jgi:hypothetical protein